MIQIFKKDRVWLELVFLRVYDEIGFECVGKSLEVRINCFYVIKEWLLELG